MTALDRSIIKAFHRPASRPESAVAAISAAATHAGKTPAVPLSQALAGLAESASAGSLMPPAEARTSPLSSAASVASSIGALLDEALQPDLPASAGNHVAFPASLVSAATSTIADIRTKLTPPPIPNAAVEPAAEESAWRPLLQVDRVVWPSIHARLQSTADAAVAQMTDGLLSLGESGRKIIGMASCASGEGVTTLLSAAAHKLLERGQKVAIVDGNWSNPTLAHCLGLLPQVGWEETLCGGIPLEEIVIESFADGLAVLPVRDPPASAIAKGVVAASLAILAQHYHVVLVDLGPSDEIEEAGTAAHDLAALMDALVLVQNVRVTPPHRLAEVCARLVASKLHYAGTIQNFVAG